MKIMVVDDEALARERLLRLLPRVQPEVQCLQASGGEEALALVESEVPDLLLLDIRMPGVDGIEVASRLGEMEQPPAIVFCTAYEEYALQALQHNAVAYLLKPVREKDLVDALANAGRVNRLQLASLQSDGVGANQGGRSQVSSQTHRGLETMPVDEIRCFIAEQKYVTAWGVGQELVIPDPLKDLEEEFGERFVRIHRNALVALKYLIRLQRGDDGGWYAVLDGMELRPVVSRRHLGNVKQALLDR